MSVAEVKGSRLKPKDRYHWIIQYMKANGNDEGERFDVLRASFVEDYIEATGAASQTSGICADTCRQLGRDLSAMYKAGNLFRTTHGIEDQWHSDFGLPKWVYSYWVRRELI